MTLLEASGISKRFGGLVALSGVSLTLEPGEAVGLVGPNGAGKTTLFDCLFGTLEPDAGTVSFAGVRLDGMPTFRRARLGIARTFQRLELFGGLTPRQHVLVTLRVRGGGGRLWRDIVGLGRTTPAEAKEARQLLALVGLEGDADTSVEALDLGSTRLVELARALAALPRLLMLDEPSSGLSDAERERVVAVIDRARREQGAAVLMVEHDLATVTAVTSRLIVLDSGRAIADGPVDAVLADAGVRHAYLGELSVR